MGLHLPDQGIHNHQIRENFDHISKNWRRGVQTVYNVKEDFGARGDGVTDDTAAFAAGIAKAAGDNTALYLPPAPLGYGIDVTGAGGNIDVPSNATIIGCGKAGRIKRIGTYVFDLGGSASVFAISGTEDISFDNIYFDGQMDSVTFPANTMSLGEAGGATSIRLTSAAGFAVSPYSAGGTITLSNGALHKHSSFTGVSGNTLTGVPGLGDAWAAGTTVAWDYENIGGTAIQCSGDDRSRLRITNCTIKDWGGVAIDIRQTDFFTVAFNHLENVYGGGIICRNNNRYGLIACNTIDHTYDDAIAINSNTGVQSEFLRIEGNRVKKESSIYTIGNESCSIRGAAHVVISGNVFEGATESCVDIRDTISGGDGYALNDILIANNNLMPDIDVHKPAKLPACGVRIADRKTSATYKAIVVRDNNIVGGVGGGVRVDTDADDLGAGSATIIDGLTVSGNTIQDCGGTAYAGIALLSGTSENVKVTDNTIIRPATQAIFVNSTAPATAIVNYAQFDNNLIRSANTTATATTDAIYLGDVNHFSCQGNTVKDAAVACRYHINIAAAADLGLTGNNLILTAEAATAAFNNAGSNMTNNANKLA